MATVTRASEGLPTTGGSITSSQISDNFTNVFAFLEATNIDEANVDLTGTDGLVGKSTAQTITGLKTFENTAAAAGGVRTVLNLSLNPSTGTATDADGMRVAILGDDDGGTQTTMAALDFVFTDTGASSEDCRLDFYVITAATLASELQLDGASLRPTTSDGLALGDADQMWSDFFAASGFVFNFDNGDVTLTHAAGKLTFGGDGAVEIDFNNHEMTNIDVNSGAIDGVIVGAASAAAGTFTTLGGTTSVTSPIFITASTPMLFKIGATEVGRVAAAQWIIGDGTTTSNANMTVGLHIDQLANDNMAFAIASSDVAHGVTDRAPTGVYFFIQKLSATAGGARIESYDDAGSQAQYFIPITTTNNTTHTAAGQAAFQIDAYKVSGTGTTAVDADANIFGAGQSGSLRFIVDKEGDIFADGSDVTVYDDRDDVGVLTAFDQMRSAEGGQALVLSRWESTGYSEKDLIDMDLIGGPRVGVDPSQRGLINYTKLARLEASAIRQLGRQQAQIGWNQLQIAEALKKLESHTGLKLLPEQEVS